MKDLWTSAQEKVLASVFTETPSVPNSGTATNSSSSSSSRPATAGAATATEATAAMARARAALDDFLETRHGQHTGLFPDRSVEDWKYTGLGHLQDFAPVLTSVRAEVGHSDEIPSWIGAVTARLGIQPERLRSDPTWHIVTFRPSEGLKVLNAKQRPSDVIDIRTTTDRPHIPGRDHGANEGEAASALWGHALESLHQAFTPAGHLLRIRKSKVSETPTLLLIEDLGADVAEQFTASQLTIALDPGSAANIIRVQLDARATESEGLQSLRVNKTTVTLGSGAVASVLLLQESAEGSHLMSLTEAAVSQDATFKCLTASTTTGLIRNHMDVRLCEKGASAQFDGYYHPSASGHIDNFSRVTHAVGNTSSQQLYKGLVEDNGHGVFRGIVKIDPGADGSSAHQLNRSILLGAGAQVDTKPELRIDADEVSCSHGASVGPLSEEEIFYLQSRALSRTEALDLLCKGFVQELAHREIPETIASHYLHWLRNEAYPNKDQVR